MTEECQDLFVLWQMAHELSQFIYKLTSPSPGVELDDLTLLLWQSSLTAECHIGMARGYGSNDLSMRFLSMAKLSISQLQTHLLQAKKLVVGDEKLLSAAEALCAKISRILDAYIASVCKKS
jgi:four helix bundle protein